MYKLSFMNFDYRVYIKLNIIVKMENYKFEVKRVTHLKAIDTITPCYFVIPYLSWNSATSLVWCHFWLQILTNKSVLAFEQLKSLLKQESLKQKSLLKQENWYLSNKIIFLSILFSSFDLHEIFFMIGFVT